MNKEADTNTGLQSQVQVTKSAHISSYSMHTYALAPILDAPPLRFVVLILMTGARRPVIRLKAEQSASPVPL